MTQEELRNVFKYIVNKCDMLINDDCYEADAYTQDTVEDIAELCNHILDGDYGKLVEVNEVDLSKEINRMWNENSDVIPYESRELFEYIAEHFFEFGFKARKGE